MATAGLAVVPVVLAALVLLPDLVGLDRHLPFAVFAALRPLLTVLAAAGVVLALVVRLRKPRGSPDGGGPAPSVSPASRWSSRWPRRSSSPARSPTSRPRPAAPR